MKSVLFVSTFALTLLGCGPSEPPPPPKAQDTVFGDMVATKERARVETEKAMQANQQKLEESMKRTDEAAK